MHLMNYTMATLFIHFFIVNLSAQDDLMKMLEENEDTQAQYVAATFKSTRIVNGHSIERMKKEQLEFRVSHRFGRLNSGAYELWGLDQAHIHFGLEYGITDWLMAGVGRGTYQKTFDGFTKVSLLRQSTGKRNIPVSASLISSIALNSLKFSDAERNNYFSSRLSYSHQLLVARKLSKRLSLQFSPTLVHRNLVPTELEPNDSYSLGTGGRIKLSNRVSVNAEYYYVINPIHYYPSEQVYNPLSVGLDIETGGHVFQLILTNSLAMIEKGYITETTGQWKKGDIHFGFNISRVFSMGR